MFLGTECPVARQYVPRLAELYREFRASGVPFVGIYSDVGVTVSRMAAHAHDEDIPFPVLQDLDHRLADVLEVTSTPEVVVLNRLLEKQYQEAIDNQHSRHGRRAVATENYLDDALRALVRGEPVERPHVPVSGCPLERRAPVRSVRPLTYFKDVAAIVQERCQKCHRKQGPGPFELVSYADVAFNAEKIREAISDHRMPPGTPNSMPAAETRSPASGGSGCVCRFSKPN